MGEPKPPAEPVISPTGEHSTPQVETTQVRLEEARAAFRDFIAGEPKGTAKATAFCDYVDKYHLDTLSNDDLRHSQRDPVREAINYAVIGETIRQRKNELPGYVENSDKVNQLYTALRDAEYESRHGDDFNLDEMKKMNDDIFEFVYEIKDDYINGRLALSAPQAHPRGLRRRLGF